ncbi:MAG: hypothetical protein KTR33_13500 [Gammaproteobacteria bacterium]|nr:hypothetical protein [Gammaproteobacteria bacterium]
MKRRSISRLSGYLFPILIIAGCGGVSTDNADEFVGQLGEANTGEIDGTPDAATPGGDNQSSSRISGRVADGYLQGATVCIDLNENGQCDIDEPAAVSGNGGSYELDVPAGAEDKPIIASVPPEAIDEDTGQPIGKKLVLSTPPGRPEFISPITTLVFEELKSNPTLDLDAAEESVLEALGLTADDETSLFADYISEQSDNDDERAKRFRHLHQTARVIANMMDDIQDRVENAAVAGGVDTEGDDATRLAIRQFVQQEVRNLLPEISLAVAEEIIGQQSGEEGTDALTASVDPDKVAGKLVPDDLEEDVLDKIDTIRELGEIKRANMQALMSAGMYWIEVDCEYSPYDHEMDFNEEIEPVEVMLSDEGMPMPIDMPAWCTAEYGVIKVEGEDQLFSQTQFVFNTETGTWDSFADEPDVHDDIPHLWHLKDGEWIAAAGDAPTGPVEFLDDGGAVVSTEEGKLLVYAGELVLDNTPVHGYLDAQNPEHDLAEDTRGEDGVSQRITDSKPDSADELFAEGSSAYYLNIQRKSLTHVLFNWYPDSDGDAAFTCDEFGGNCNVVDLLNEDGFSPLQTLEHLREQTLDSAVIVGMLHSPFEGRPIDLRLDAKRAADGSLPVGGTATWFMPPYYPAPGIEPAPGELPYPGEECEPVVDTFVPGTDVPVDETGQQVLFDAASEDNEPMLVPCIETPIVIECEDHLIELEVAGVQNDEAPALPDDLCVEPDDGTQLQLADDADLPVEVRPVSTDGENRILGTSNWKLIEVDGVTMLEVGIPVPVRHSADELEAASLLLIEHEGFVRRGARLGAAMTDIEIMYSEAAFETLKPYAEHYVSEQ